MKQQALGPVWVRVEGQRRPRPTDVRRQSPHDGVVASEPVTVVVVVNDGDFDGHAIQVNHAVDHGGGLRRSNAWERPGSGEESCSTDKERMNMAKY